MSDETKARNGKVQFTTSADDADWFKDEAGAEGMSQRELFAEMRAAYEERKGKAQEATETSAVDELTCRIRDLVAGAMTDARRDLEGELAGEVSRRESAEAELESAQERLAECEGASDVRRELESAQMELRNREALLEERANEIAWLRSQVSGAKGTEA